jgi:hypothetical protein
MTKKLSEMEKIINSYNRKLKNFKKKFNKLLRPALIESIHELEKLADLYNKR